MNIILNFITLGVKPVYEKHLAYYNVIKEFRDKLPRRQNEAKIFSEEEKSRNPVLADLKYIKVADLSTQKISVTEADIDLFYNKLNNFDYSHMLFKNYYKAYTNNLNRFNPNAENRNFDLFVVQQVIKDNPLKPLKPLEVLFFQLKWNVKVTSKVYVWFLKRTKNGVHL